MLLRQRKQRRGWFVLWPGSVLLVAACGGGGGTSRIISSTPTPEPEAPASVTAPGTSTGPSVSFAGTARAVANSLYAYQASVTGGVGLAFSWVWGDGSLSAAGNPVQQVWNRPGSYDGLVNATVGSTAATRPFSVVVVGEPISSGVLNACALKPDGSVACWGENVDGQLGNGTFTTNSSLPVSVTGLAGVVAVKAGGAHNCLLKPDRTASCWGRNEKGALGDGTAGTGTSKALPTAVPGLTNEAAISEGKQHTCALRSNGTAFCWGANGSGQLVNNSVATVSPPAPAPAPVQVANLTGAVAIDAGTDHTCALKGDGTAVCWGQNTFAQLGFGTLINKATPVQVQALSGAISINAGNRHSCAVKADGRAACWGENVDGQLGDATGVKKTIATIVPGLAGAVSISAGKSHTCALKTDGSAACWGLNDLGQLGDGTLTTRTSVTPVLGGAVYWK